MPYIKQDLRPRCEALIDVAMTMTEEDAVHYLGNYAPSAGERNYCWCRWALRQEPKGYTEWRHYVGLIAKAAEDYPADYLGDTWCMLLELYRRKIVHYERQKIRENGDIEGFPPETA